MQHFFLIRHCKAKGQEPDAPLTPTGKNQAEKLAAFLKKSGIGRIVSSPFKRAYESVAPLAKAIDVTVEIDNRLCERKIGAGIGSGNLESVVRESFQDPLYKLPKGESHIEARKRGMEAIREILEAGKLPAVIASHGNMIAILLNYFDSRYKYKHFTLLTHPDVYKVVQSCENSFRVKRVNVKDIF